MLRRPCGILGHALLLIVTCEVSWSFSVFGQTSSSGENRDLEQRRFRFAAIDDASLGLWDGEKPVVVYNHGARSKGGDPSTPPHRSYIHPLYGLDGEILTDDFPADHLHHRGIFWAWPHVTVDGHHYDLWMQSGIECRFHQWTVQKTDRDHALLGVENLWYVGARPVMREQLLLRVHRADLQGRAIDLTLTWTPIDRPITLGGAEEKSYGGLTIRYAPGTETQITVPSGLTKDDLYMTRLPWADFTRVWTGQDKPSGAAVFIHPANPDHPPTWLTRHYGALCVGWPGVQPKTLEAGKPVQCRYRIWVHRGRPDAKQLASAFAAYLAESGQPDDHRRPATLPKTRTAIPGH
jgi:hypothetical protein